LVNNRHIEPNYFQDEYVRIVVAAIKNAKQVYDVLPDMGSLEARLLDEISGDVQRRYAISQLRKNTRSKFK
jgi:hypothetical protein